MAWLFPRRWAVLATASLALAGIARADSPPASAVERTLPTQVELSTYKSPAIVLQPVVGTASANRQFTLSALNIDGATIFSQQQLSRHFEEFLATRVDEARLAQIAQAITKHYQRKGYILSYASVPEQNVEAGMVRLQVVEGRVGHVVIEGAGPATPALNAIAAPLVSERVLKRSTLERTLGLMRDFPGLRLVDATLIQSDIRAGLYTLKVIMVPTRIRAFLYGDNRGIAGMGRVRLFTSASVSSLFTSGDEFRAELFGMPGDRSSYDFGELLASVPIGTNGLRLSLSGSRGNQYLRSTDRFDGRSDNFNAEFSYPLRRSRDLSMFGKVSLGDSLTTGSAMGVRRIRDHLRVARIGVSLLGEGRTQFRADFVFSKGLPFPGETRVGDPLASRSGASGKFNKAAASIDISHPLSSQLTLRGTFIAQYADRPLLAAEEFSLGGSRVGRAFEFNSRAGARGAGAGVELGYRFDRKHNDGSGRELFAFADGGFVTVLQGANTEAARKGISSVGAGVRFSLRKVSIAMESGVPLSTRHSPRVFVTLFRAF